VPENGADVAHLNQLHKPVMVAGTDLRSMHNLLGNIIQHQWFDVCWNPDPDNQHISLLNLKHTIRVLGHKLFPITDLTIEVKQVINNTVITVSQFRQTGLDVDIATECCLH
jgi:cholesterol 7-dehydrogenase